MDIQRILRGVRKKIRQYPIFYPSKNEDALRWGIIGLGNMAGVFAAALDDDRNSNIVAVASRSLDKAKAFAKKHGKCKAYGSYEEMVADKSLNLDVVYIATPVKYHANNIKLCLDADVNVLCEKPITFSAVELQPLMDSAKEKGLFLMEGMWMKCLPSFLKAKEWLEKGFIGDLDLIKVDFNKREIVNTERGIFKASEGGGVMHDYGVYAISFITTFLDGLPEVLRFEKRMSHFDIDSDWQIYAEKKGVKAFVNLSSDFNSLSKAALIGSKGVIEWNSQFNRTNRLLLFDEYGKRKESFEVKYKSEGFEYEIAEVYNCVKSNKTQSSLNPLEESMSSIQLIDSLTSTKL